jgi:hypothetical protein
MHPLTEFDYLLMLALGCAAIFLIVFAVSSHLSIRASIAQRKSMERLEVEREVLSVLSQCMSFARSDYHPPSKWRRFKWWARIEKRPPPLPPIPAGTTIRIAKPPRYVTKVAK